MIFSGLMPAVGSSIPVVLIAVGELVNLFATSMSDIRRDGSACHANVKG